MDVQPGCRAYTLAPIIYSSRLFLAGVVATWFFHFIDHVLWSTHGV